MSMRMTRTAKRTAPIMRFDDNEPTNFDAIAQGFGITREEAITRIVRQMEWRVAALERKANALVVNEIKGLMK